MINTITDFNILNFPFLDGDILRRPSYGVYICQLIRFARVCSHVDDFNTRDKCFLNRGFGIISLERLFPSSIADTMNFTRQKKETHTVKFPNFLDNNNKYSHSFYTDLKYVNRAVYPMNFKKTVRFNTLFVNCQRTVESRGIF